MSDSENGKETRTSASTPAAESATREERGRRVAASPSASAESSQAEIDRRFRGLEFTVGVSRRYHARRRRWFENWHNAGMAASVFSATAAVAAVAGQNPEIAKWIAIAFAGVTACDLTIGFSRRAETHASLYREFSSLASQMAERLNSRDRDFRRWEAARLQIETDEPPVLDTLNVLCHNDEVEARGLLRGKRQLNWFDKALAQITSIRSSYPPVPIDEKSDLVGDA